MARKITQPKYQKYKYKTYITVEEMREKKYRKYLYPQEIDGIVFEDDTEKKLSESSWFRCLPPQKQILVEKEIRQRMQGEFNHTLLYFDDPLTDAAPAIPKPVFARLAESLTGNEALLLMAMIPHITINDGTLRAGKKRTGMSLAQFAMLCDKSPKTVRDWLLSMQNKRILLTCAERGVIDENDAYLDLADISDKARQNYLINRRCLTYINPFIVFFGQYIDAYTMPFFVNSGWYAINPYADKINAWINTNCR